jgi:hypothetical protein
MTFTWSISKLVYEIDNGFVTTAYWQAVAVDGTYNASIFSTTTWPLGSPVVPYDQLTQEMVLGWVWASGSDKDTIEASLAANIALQKNPVTATGTPWATS